jgi:biopolymer transport protein TolQ
MEMNIGKIILEASFVVQFVLGLLVLCSIGSWVIIFKKYKQMSTIRKEDKSFYDGFKECHSLESIQSHAIQYNNSTFVNITNKVVEDLSFAKVIDDKSKLSDYMEGVGKENVDRAISNGFNSNQTAVSDRLSTLASISSVAPFLGLFGTVWGIINSFRGLATGGGSIEAIAPGIAEALVATAVGLAAAIPANWFYNIFLSKLSKLNVEMENFSNELVNKIKHYVMED